VLFWFRALKQYGNALMILKKINKNELIYQKAKWNFKKGKKLESLNMAPP
tara:strand:+ start:717 stop:866 length:150 start_codon:yes stop_codon:yes gene_type:complete